MSATLTKIEIKNRWSGSVLFSHEAEKNTLKIALSMALKAGANLRSANLYGADLRGADLFGADLCGGVKLSGARPYFQIGPIGSRNDYLQSYVTDSGIYLRAGCFFGTRDEFVAQLDAEHGDNEHAQEYRAALALIDKHAELFPADAQIAEAA